MIFIMPTLFMTGKQRMYGLPMENSSGIIMFYTIFIIVPESIWSVSV